MHKRAKHRLLSSKSAVCHLLSVTAPAIAPKRMVIYALLLASLRVHAADDDGFSAAESGDSPPTTTTAPVSPTTSPPLKAAPTTDPATAPAANPATGTSSRSEVEAEINSAQDDASMNERALKPLRARTKPLSVAKPPQKPRRPSGDLLNFTEPLRFDPEDNGLSIENPQLKWAMDGTTKIKLGGLNLKAEQIRVALTQINRDQAPARFDSKTSKFLTTLSFQWPEILIKSGLVTIETPEGKEMWGQRVTEADRKGWQDVLSYSNPAIRNPHMKGSWGIADVDKDKLAFLYKGGLFRMCLHQVNSKIEALHICSAVFKTKGKGERIKLLYKKEKPDATSSFAIGDKVAEKNGIVNFKIGAPVRIKITFGNESFIDIASQPVDPEILDAVEGTDNDIVLTGIGAQPLGKKVKILKRPITNFWAPTGIPQERIWQISVPTDAPLLRTLGAFNVPFTLLFTYDRLPTEADRVYIRKTRSSGTYSYSPIVEGYAPSMAQVSSKEYSARKVGAAQFEWSFAAPKKGAENRAHLLIQKEGDERPWVAHYRMYRSYPFEISGRLTGIIDSDFTLIVMGEVSAAAWFETFAGLDSPTFSKQRWGVAARYLKALTSVQTSTGLAVNDLSVINADLKYNILSGIWHRDEIVGAMLSAEQVSVAGYSGNLAGIGGYWARTMPRIFNDIFNLVPGFDYPKYVDMELIAFPLALDSSTTPGLSFNLNFHGRVFWTHRFYGEAGFGVRQYSFTKPSVANKGHVATINLGMAYGTFGIGWVF